MDDHDATWNFELDRQAVQDLFPNRFYHFQHLLLDLRLFELKEEMKRKDFTENSLFTNKKKHSLQPV